MSNSQQLLFEGFGMFHLNVLLLIYFVNMLTVINERSEGITCGNGDKCYGWRANSRAVLNLISILCYFVSHF